MFSPVDTSQPGEVEKAVEAIYLRLYPDADAAFVSRIFAWANQCFTGRFADYQAVDAQYHDFEHTLQGTLCLARLLAGRHAAKAKPILSRHDFELGMLAILFHDTGYLKKKEDTEGTGAKYTLTHEERSAAFAQEFLAPQGLAAEDIREVQNMIRCTGVITSLALIPFRREEERIVGFSLATADLLGQMAALDYVDKLPVLYQEFAEAVSFSGREGNRLARYASAEDLIENTPLFFEDYVLPRIEDDFRGQYRFLNDPFPDGPNPYLDQIRKNIGRLRH